MRHITVSILSLLVFAPALADARLPVVNLAAGGVSARAAFGEAPVEAVAEKAEKTETVAKKSTPKSTRTVVARAASKKAVSDNKTVKVANNKVEKDSGEQIFARADVLSPRRPSSDLWARSTTTDEVPLRLPSPQEFSVFRSDDILPEESLDSKPVAVAKADTAQVVRSVAPRQEGVVASAEPMSQLDAQIARLTELQRRAEASVSQEIVPVQVARAEIEDTRPVVKRSEPTVASNKQTSDEEVKLSRMVVPMDEDVIVRSVEKSESPRIATVRNDMTSMSPTELRKAFRKTFLSENKHLSTFQIDDRFDVASDMTSNMEGFTSRRDLSETGGIRPLEIKIKFRNEDAALSRDNYNLLTEYAGIVLSNPTRAIQISIPERATRNSDDRKLAARRLAIVEQVLRDTGVSEYRIMPVLSQRDEEGFVLRMISSEQYETLTQQKRDMFGDSVSKKTYKSMSW